MVMSYQGHLQEHSRGKYPITESFMSKSFYRVKPDLNIYQAMALLLNHGVTAAIVVDDHDRLQGIVSENECLQLAAQDTYESVSPGGPVENFMVRDVKTVSLQTGLNEVVELFLKYPFRKLPVLDGDRVVGVVRRRDILEVLENFYRRRMEDVNS